MWQIMIKFERKEIEHDYFNFVHVKKLETQGNPCIVGRQMKSYLTFQKITLPPIGGEL